jgi:hypothetical protein
MSRVISFRDLRLITELAEYTELELVSMGMDAVVLKYLGKLGFDMEYGIVYEPALHRDLQGNVGIGFRAIGEISCNRNFINSDLCFPYERLIAAAHSDMSLAYELGTLQGTYLDYKSFHELEGGADFEDSDEFDKDDIEPDYETVKSQIEALYAVRDNLRGNVYNESGSIKSGLELLLISEK